VVLNFVQVVADVQHAEHVNVIKMEQEQKSFVKKIVGASAFIGGLCCFTPIVLVLLGLSTVSFATSLADTLYGTYKWVFRGVALLFLTLALYWYIYKKEKICTIDELKKKKRKIINLVLITLISAILAYIVWLYVVVEVIGILLGIWG
jgi:amino acid transporter